MKEGEYKAFYMHFPLVREDIVNVNKIVDSINSRTQEKNDTYVAVGEQLFNSDTIRNVRLPEIINATPSASFVSDVDLRDGFPSSFLSAHYVLACNSPSCTYNNGEEILRYINTEIINTESHIGKHYNLIESYDIDGGLTIKIYERVSDYSINDLELIAKHFDEIYPHHEELFRDRIL